MPSDEIIKRSVRLPKSVHAEIERAADAGGMTANAEMVFRLKHDPRDDSTAAVLAEIRHIKDTLVESLTRQNAALWAVLDRTDRILADVVSAMSQVQPGSDAATLKREVEFARELISMLEAGRPENPGPR